VARVHSGIITGDGNLWRTGHTGAGRKEKSALVRSSALRSLVEYGTTTL
jgi:hypothetical protein